MAKLWYQSLSLKVQYHYSVCSANQSFRPASLAGERASSLEESHFATKAPNDDVTVTVAFFLVSPLAKCQKVTDMSLQSTKRRTTSCSLALAGPSNAPEEGQGTASSSLEPQQHLATDILIQ